MTSALDVVTKEMANAARDQNTAVLMKEQALNTSFDEREFEMEENQKTLRDAVDRLTAESAERGDAIERLERELKTSNAALEESTKTEKESTARIAVLTKELEQAKADATRFLETSRETRKRASRVGDARARARDRARYRVEVVRKERERVPAHHRGVERGEEDVTGSTLDVGRRVDAVGSKRQT